MLRLADLREILHYVPQYRVKLFVIALDGAVVEDDNFRNLLLDVAHHDPARCGRVDPALLDGRPRNDTLRVIPPLGCDGEGNTWRLNSDAVAVEVARALQAVKLIYLTTAEGVTVRQGDGPPELL